MREFFMEYFIITCALVGLISAQLLKPIFGLFLKGKFDISEVAASGGFPSSHTSFVIALTTAIALREGLSSTTFAIALVLSFIIMYDATNVRYYAGKNISLTQQIIRDLRDRDFKLDSPIYIDNIKEILGHERLEVFAGFILGIVVSILMNFILF